MADRHLPQFALEPRRHGARKSEKILRDVELENEPVKNTPLLGQGGRVVKFSRQGEKLVVAAQAVEAALDPVGLFAPFQETDFDRVPVGMRKQGPEGSGVSVSPKHDHAGKGQVLLLEIENGEG